MAFCSSNGIAAIISSSGMGLYIAASFKKHEPKKRTDSKQ